MSSYFDKAQAMARESIDIAREIEQRVISDVLLVAGDREFPDDLRAEIVRDIALHSIDSKAGATRGRDWYELMHTSEMIAILHERFHTLATRRIETRFGVLSDRPAGILAARDHYIAEHISSNSEG